MARAVAVYALNEVRKAAGNSAVGLMPVAIPKEGTVIERRRLNDFKVKTQGKSGAAVFRRDGLGWKLAGVDMPYRCGDDDK